MYQQRNEKSIEEGKSGKFNYLSLKNLKKTCKIILLHVNSIRR